MPYYLVSHWMINALGLATDRLIISILQQLHMYIRTVMHEPHIVAKWSLLN